MTKKPSVIHLPGQPAPADATQVVGAISLEEIQAMKEENELLRNQIIFMREIYAKRALVLLDMFLDAINYTARKAGEGLGSDGRIVAGQEPDPQAQQYGARIDSLRVALGLPPRPVVTKPAPEATDD